LDQVLLVMTIGEEVSLMGAPVVQLSAFAEEVGENASRSAGAELAASLPESLDGLSDDELLAAAADARRVTSWAQARELAAVAELHRRRLEAEEDGDADYRILDAHESTIQETSAALAITTESAARLIDLGERLNGILTGTCHALETGHIDKSKALVLDELTHGLDPELVGRIEATVLPTADQRTTGQLRRRIRTLIKRLAPEQLKTRKREAVQDRRLEVWDDEYSGTSGLSVFGLDPVRAHGTFNRITAAAHGIKAEGDPRGLHQLRADLAQQLLSGHPLPEAIRHARASAHPAEVGQEATRQAARPDAHSGASATSTAGALTTTAGTVSAENNRTSTAAATGIGRALTGPSAKSAAASAEKASPADVSGADASDVASVSAAAIPSGSELASDAIAEVIADMADRELAALRDHLKAAGREHALAFRLARAAHDIHDRLTALRESWCRAHDPHHGRAFYRPSRSLRQAIETRHITCVFPTCNRRSDRCDADHTVPWGQGKSCRCNLAPLCRKHHRLKQTPGWRLIQPWPGLLIWITPSGNWHLILPARE
jgi:hypothetical protein